MEDTLWASLTDNHIKTPMAITAENLAEKYAISREECDQFALQSQQRWAEGELKYIQPNWPISINVCVHHVCATAFQFIHIFFVYVYVYIYVYVYVHVCVCYRLCWNKLHYTI